MSAGSSSWSTGESLDPELHRLLYVRQALVGQAEAALDPPALRHRPPAVDVPADQVPAALAEWGRWWRSTLTLVLVQQGHDVPGAEIVRGWAQRSSPPEDASPHWHEEGTALHDAYEAVRPEGAHRLSEPVLRAVVDQVEMDAHRWVNQHHREVTALQATGDLWTVRRGSVPWAVTREVAEDVVFDRGVDPERVRASTLLADVEDDAGTWWREVAHGAVLCSFDAALHPVTARVMLRHAFTARL